MKLTKLFEGLRVDVLELQQQLIDALDNEFNVDLKAGSRSAEAGREAYTLQVRHPLLKLPVNISVLAGGPRGPEVKVGSYMQFDISHPRGHEGLMQYIQERVDHIKIHKWLIENGFTETDKAEFERKMNIRLLSSGFIKSNKFFVKPLPGMVKHGVAIAFKLGFDSYNNVQHEWWEIKNSDEGWQRGHRIHSFDELDVQLGSIIRTAK